jgi:hypothetical protein
MACFGLTLLVYYISVFGRFLPSLTPNMHGRRCDPVIRQAKLYDTPSSPAIRNHANF